MKIIKTQKFDITAPGGVFSLSVGRFDRVFMVADTQMVVSIVSDVEIATDLLINGKLDIALAFHGTLQLVVKTEQNGSLIVSFISNG